MAWMECLKPCLSSGRLFCLTTTARARGRQRAASGNGGGPLTGQGVGLVDEAEAVQLAAEPVREGEAELAQLRVREAPVHPALVHLPVEEHVGEPVVLLAEGRIDRDVGRDLVDLREVVEGVAEPIPAVEEDPVDRADPVLRIRKHEEEVPAADLALRPAREGLEAEGHVGAEVEQAFLGFFSFAGQQLGPELFDGIVAFVGHLEKIGRDGLDAVHQTVDLAEKIGTERQLHRETLAQCDEQRPYGRGTQGWHGQPQEKQDRRGGMQPPRLGHHHGRDFGVVRHFVRCNNFCGARILNEGTLAKNR